MIPTALPLVADIASILAGTLTIGKEVHTRMTWPSSDTTPFFHRQKRTSSWMPITINERIRDYFSNPNRPDYPSITDGMRLF